MINEITFQRRSALTYFAHASMVFVILTADSTMRGHNNL